MGAAKSVVKKVTKVAKQVIAPSVPKMPKPVVQQIVYTPASVSPPPPPVSTAPTDAEIAAEKDKVRAENIIRRNRSQLGTILTSFRGLLERGSSAPQRKTLLGE